MRNGLVNGGPIDFRTVVGILAEELAAVCVLGGGLPAGLTRGFLGEVEVFARGEIDGYPALRLFISENAERPKSVLEESPRGIRGWDRGLVLQALYDRLFARTLLDSAAADSEARVNGPFTKEEAVPRPVDEEDPVDRTPSTYILAVAVLARETDTPFHEAAAGLFHKGAGYCRLRPADSFSIDELHDCAQGCKLLIRQRIPESFRDGVSSLLARLRIELGRRWKDCRRQFNWRQKIRTAHALSPCWVPFILPDNVHKEGKPCEE